MLNNRIFTNIKEKSIFQGFKLPCFYPVHEFSQKEQMTSSQKIIYPPN